MRGRLRWRDYRTVAGARPIKSFIDDLADDEAAAVVAAMKEVAVFGLERARHLHDDLYEVRAESARRSFRILFAKEAKFILLSLSAFVKKTQKTPLREVHLAARRLADWRSRRRSRS